MRAYLEVICPEPEADLLAGIDVDSQDAHRADAFFAFRRHFTQLSHPPAVLSHHIHNAWVSC